MSNLEESAKCASESNYSQHKYEETAYFESLEKNDRFSKKMPNTNEYFIVERGPY